MKLIRFSFTLILFLFVTLAVKAGGDGSSKYYKVTANSNATGRGLVYASADTEHGPWLFKESISSRHYGSTSTSQSGKIYLYASPNEGFALEKWTNASGTTVTSGSTITFNASSTDITAPTANVFTAHFVDTYVSVFSANNDLCTVSISKPINAANETVTLTATPKSGATFLGWRIKGTATILSTQQNYSVQATSTKTTYEAVFSYTGTQQQFVRMQSQSEQGKYLSMVKDEFSYTPIIVAAGGYSKISSADGKTKALNKASEYLSNDFSLNESVYDPGQIILHDATNQNFFAQGTNVGYITDGYNCHHAGNLSGMGNYVGASHLKIDAQKIKHDSYFRLTMNPTVNLENTGQGSGTQELGNIYIVNNNGSISVTQTASSSDQTHKWNKMNIDNSSQYFAFNPDKYDTRTGKYYTTLRTSFSYKIKNSDKVTAYEINEILADGTAVMTPFAAGEIIPGDLAVVLESSSQEPIDNILEPYNLEYTKTNTVLFNKYGKRLHCYTGDGANGNYDQYDQCTEGGIGYFKVNYNSGTMGDMYKLDVNSDGEVGFWTKVINGTVSGNEAYSTKQCALFKNTQLKNLPETADQITYCVNDPLTVAYIDNDDLTIYAKDDNGASEQTPADGKIDFMAEHYSSSVYDDANYGDHSNWVAVKVASLPSDLAVKNKINVIGKVVANSAPNRTIQGQVTKLDNGDFTPNTYSIANFFGSTGDYFFAKPLPNEIVKIIWAMWDENATTGSFIVPTPVAGTNINAEGFEGGVYADFSLYEGSSVPELQQNHVYKFLGLVRKETATESHTAKATTYPVSSEYVIYPLKDWKEMGAISDDGIITGISNIYSNNIVGVKYYNLAGMASDVPFDGINIRVTTFSDGSKQAVKVLY